MSEKKSGVVVVEKVHPNANVKCRQGYIDLFVLPNEDKKNYYSCHQRKGRILLIHTGVSITIPEGYCGLLSITNHYHHLADEDSDADEEEADDNGFANTRLSYDVKPSRNVYPAGCYPHFAIVGEKQADWSFYLYDFEVLARLFIVQLHPDISLIESSSKNH